MIRRSALLCLATVVAVTGCNGHSAGHRAITPSTNPSTSVPPSTPTPTPDSAKDGKTVWLCRPGRQPDPCQSDLATTVVEPSGRRTTEHVANGIRPPADCFYAYPTVSGEPGRNADLRIQEAETQVAEVQAARFSTACDVWSPMYRQRTISDLFNLTDGAPDSVANRTAYRSLRDGWRAFLAAHNHKRPIVLIGHSQGASMLIRLVRDEIDNNPAVRRHIALAILLGGNLTVATGSTTGGDFAHVPLCTRPGQPGCVIAYSSFPKEPPAAAFFGRPGRGVSLLSGNTQQAGLQVACVNPVSPGSTKALGLHPYFPSRLAQSGASTTWTAYPGHGTAQCRSADGATWLQVLPTAAGRTTSALLHPRLGSLWGFHDVDVNLALGDLVDDAKRSVAQWYQHH